VASVPLPTASGTFDARAFQCSSGFVYLALVRGRVEGRRRVLTRLHSECLTGDALGSLRCDCGVQLRVAMRAIAAEGRGVLLYATGHEGRGIGLVEKLRAYVEQDKGADTLEANLRLGHAVDSRDYGDAAAVLAALGMKSVRLLTNNPTKVEGLRACGIDVAATVAIPTSPHARNLGYLQTKERSLGHVQPTGTALADSPTQAIDASTLMGTVAPRHDRPYVILKYAQTLDGRIATSSGDARWISGEAERRVSHSLRAGCDAVLVGIGTVLLDDPQLTVRMVPGSSPLRVVLDSELRLPPSAKVLDGDAATLVLTTDRSDPRLRRALADRQVRVRVVPESDDGVDLVAALAVLRQEGVASLLVEGGAQVITSLLGQGLVDRVVVGVAPKIIGTGTEAVGPLGVARVADGIQLTNRCVHVVGEDVILAWDVERNAAAPEPVPVPVSVPAAAGSGRR
jgi:3,4-dihydroxy 2-butanone 4-phosphate synthase/GTP cyclohydrolase II